MSSSAFRLPMDRGGAGDFVADAGNLDNIFSEFMDETGRPPGKTDAPITMSKDLQPPESASQTIFAKVVVAFKLINLENVSQGNIGLALIQNINDFRIILYRSKQDILTTFTLTMTSVIYAKRDYVQFRDDSAQFWSVRFQTDSNRDDFLAIVEGKCLIEKETLSILPQNLQELPAVIQETETLSTTTSKKPSLVSRMAKMGGHQLPQINRSSKDTSSDSDDTEPSATKPKRNQMVPSKWKPDVPTRLPQHHQFSRGNVSPPLVATNTLISYNPVDQEMVSLFTENRFQNTEVRMCLSKLESKIERVLDKIDTIKLSSNSEGAVKPKSDLEEEMIKLEEKILELRKENRLLRIAQDEGNNKVQQQNDNEERLQKEKTKNEELQLLLEDLTNRIQNYQSEITEKVAEIESLRLKHSRYLENNDSRSSKMQKEIDELNSLRKEHKEREEHLESEIKRLEKESNDTEARLKTKIDTLQEQLQDLQREPVVHKNDTTSALIKGIMNSMYQTLQESVVQRAEWSSDNVLALVRTTIKRETLNALNPSS